MSELSKKQIHIIEHSLGLTRKRSPYRNYFEDRLTDDIKFLVDNGFMTCRASNFIPDKYYFFFVTPKGIDAVKGNGYTKRNKKRLIENEIISNILEQALAEEKKNQDVAGNHGII